MTLTSRALWRKIQLRHRPCPFFIRCALYSPSSRRQCTTEVGCWTADDNHNFNKSDTSTSDSLIYKIKMKGLDLKGLKEQLPAVNKSHYTIAVEGNIGSGKSTLMKHFEGLPNIEILGEPLDKWTNLDGHNALGLLYEDPERWSFSFNMYAMLSRMELHRKQHTNRVKFLERSIYSSRYCFVENNHIFNTINGLEYAVLDRWFHYLTKDHKADLDLIVYLRAEPEVCHERIEKRSRAEEAGIPLSFIQSLHKVHDDWLIHKKYPVPAPVLILDANYDLEKMKETYDLHRGQILCDVRGDVSHTL